MSTFSLSQVGGRAEFDGLLTQVSKSFIKRDLEVLPVKTARTNLTTGITTVFYTVSIRPTSPRTTTSVVIPTMSMMDVISSGDVFSSPDGSVSILCPEKEMGLHPKVKEAGVSFYGSCIQKNPASRYEYIKTADGYSFNSTLMPNEYEFFCTFPFPSDFTQEQIVASLEDGVKGSCVWYIRQGLSFWFALKPERVLRDVRRRFSQVKTVSDLHSFLRVERSFTMQPATNIQNIFPRLEVVDGKLVNTSIINSESYVGKESIRSAGDQSVVWSWVIGLFNDTDIDGPWSPMVGPSILDIKRSDWEFFNFNECSEFELVDSDTERARIDKENKKIYFSSKRRTVFSLQLRQERTDKGEDYIGYTNYPNDICNKSFYSDSLLWFLKNTYTA
jgi:hypothetical protein